MVGSLHIVKSFKKWEYCKGGINIAIRDSLKQDEIVEMDELIDDFISQPSYVSAVSKDIRETVLNGRNVVFRFVIEEVEGE